MLDALVDLVLPRCCAGCGRPGSLLCGACLPREPARAVAPDVWAAGDYDGALRSALLAYKERGRRELARPLGRLLASALPPGGAGLVLVPVPSRRAAVRERGGDHVLRLARVAGRAAGLRVRPALRLVREVADSAGLHREERAANLSGVMRARPPAGAPALIVDDIVTTGATLQEAARALRAAGWPVAGAAVVAATPLLARRASGTPPGPGTISVPRLP